jgi:hypothetical protein
MPDVLRFLCGFAQTGGMHAVGLFTADGELSDCRERRGAVTPGKLVGAD